MCPHTSVRIDVIMRAPPGDEVLYKDLVLPQRKWALFLI
jgi:hypothetical protein